jgi:hypothetical protein
MRAIANYEQPRKRIEELALADSACRAIFIEGGKDLGKTHLLDFVRETCGINFIVVSLGKQRATPSPKLVLDEIAQELGWARFPRLRGAMRGRSLRPIQASINDVTILGSHNSIEAIAQETEEDRLIEALELTEHLIEDLRVVTCEIRPLIIAFDHYDEATSLIDGWFSRSLVSSLCRLDHIRLIVCGRDVSRTSLKGKIPGARFLELGLEGVRNAEHWLPVVQYEGLTIPFTTYEEKIAFLTAVVEINEGVPGLIMSQLRWLCRRKGRHV